MNCNERPAAIIAELTHRRKMENGPSAFSLSRHRRARNGNRDFGNTRIRLPFEAHKHGLGHNFRCDQRVCKCQDSDAIDDCVGQAGRACTWNQRIVEMDAVEHNQRVAGRYYPILIDVVLKCWLVRLLP